MAKINLLPWRDAKRERSKREFFWNVGISVLCAGLGVVVVFLMLDTSLNNQEPVSNSCEDSINTFLNTKLDY